MLYTILLGPKWNMNTLVTRGDLEGKHAAHASHSRLEAEFRENEGK